MRGKHPGRKFYRRSSDLSGLPPGTLSKDELSGIQGTNTLAVIEYNKEKCLEKRSSTFSGLSKGQFENSVIWVDLDGITDTGILEEAGREFGIHPLTLEDILNNTQRPKCDEFENYVFITLRMLSLPYANGQIESEQLSLIVINNCVLTFQEKAGGDVFNPLRERIRTAHGKIRQLGPDYLAYALLDAIIDNYFVILEDMGTRLESLESAMMGTPGKETVSCINGIKKELIFIRKAVWPLRELISGLERAENTRFSPVVRIYLRDLYDHVIQAIDTIETFREMSSGMLDVYLSRLSIRLNEIMKLLTVMSTIFIPLTFIAGIYGMNFEFMPELKWKWGYPLVWLLFISVAGGLLFFFKRRKWL